MRKKGFTLIEMLIVIAVIGILAIAVLSAINPVEQTRKARDARRRSNAAELLNAVERYYTTYEENSSYFTTGIDLSGDCTGAIGVTVAAGNLQDLITADELKAEFSNRLVQDDLFRTMDAASDLVKICYQIESKANIDVATTAGVECISGTGDVFVCVPE